MRASSAKEGEKRTPIVTDGMTTGEFGQIPEKARAMEEAKSCGRRMWEEGKPFALEVGGHEGEKDTEKEP